MYKSIFVKSLFLAILVNSTLSCDNDSNELGSDIIGGNNFETGTPETYDVKALNVNTGPVETLDLPINALGIYNNPVFGVSKANLAVQVQMDDASLGRTFDSNLNPKITSVVLTLPYFSTAGTTNENGVTPYTLDSIYGPINSKIQLRIYESGFYIRDLDPVLTEGTQRYYSNQDQAFFDAKGAQINDTTDTSQNDNFIFSPAQIVEPGVVTDEDPTPADIRSAPAMKIYLNKTFFKNKIFNAPADKLISNNALKEYFRGLYFHVDYSGSDPGCMALLNVDGGKITIKYTQFETAPTAAVPNPETVEKTFVLNLRGKSVNLLNTQSTLVHNANNIYLKGGEGSMAVIDLFGPDTDGDGVADKLKELRDSNWLVNDASLTFHIDKTAMGPLAEEPNRIYLYDIKNKRPLVDYFLDQTSSSKPKYGKSTHDGIIRQTDGRGTSYKIRLTNHIRGLINNIDSTNVRLGLVVTENIADFTNRKVKTPPTADIKEIPVASIINPLGTILYGSDIPVGADGYEKRIQLKIYYTKPKQN